MTDSVLLTDDQPVDPDDELLVAYLDGELADQDRRNVEKRLVSDPVFQKRMQALETGWEWLDEMPSEGTNEKLVESTIEMVVANIVPQHASQSGWFKRHWKAVLFSGAIGIAFVAGVGGTAIAKWMALRDEMRELAIAEDHEAFKLHQSGANFSLYRALAYNNQFHDMVAALERIGERELVSPSIVREIPLEERAEAIQELPTEIREKLTTRWEAYSGYDESTKQQIRATANLVESQDDSELLLRTMKAAAVWIEGLGDDLRDRLNSSDEAVRRAAIDDAIMLTMAELAQDSGKLLTDETCDKIYFWLRYRLRKRLEDMPELAEALDRVLHDSEIPIEGAEYPLLRYMVDEPRGRSRFGMFPPWFFSANSPFAPLREFLPSRGSGSRSDASQSDEPGSNESRSADSRFEKALPPLTDDELRGLMAMLDEQVLADLNRFTELLRAVAGDVAVDETLRIWAAEAVRRSLPRRSNSDPGLLERYTTHREKDRLDLSAPEEIRREVFDASRDPWRVGRSRGGR